MSGPRCTSRCSGGSCGLPTLPSDALEVITAQLGMGVFELRQVCKALSKIRASLAQELAFKAARKAPIFGRIRWTARTPPERLSRSIVWREWTYRMNLKWRVDWAPLVWFLDQAPIDVLIDAYELLRPTRFANILTTMKQVLEDRLWDLCCGKHVYKGPDGTEIVKIMDEQTSTRVVSRLFDRRIVHNGSTSFVHSKYGWLKLTPFLLAVERNNLTLAKYLYFNSEPAVTVFARSQAGNNAYALCHKELLRNGATPEDIRDSEMLAWLKQLGVEPQEAYDEYEAYGGFGSYQNDNVLWE